MAHGTITEEIKIIKIQNGEIKFKVFATHPESAIFVVAYSDILSSK